MKITDITAHKLRNGRLLVRVYTDEGITGLADCSQSLAVFRAYLDEAVIPRLAGRDPRQPRQLWAALALGAGGHGRGVPSQIAGAIDIALWDITGKAAGMPVYTLLGGASRTEVPLYWSLGWGWRKSPEEMLDGVQEGWDRGFRAFKVRMDWGDWRQDVDPNKDFHIFQTCREWLSDDAPLGFDANNGYSVSTAITQGRGFEELGIAHFEEPLPRHDLPGLRQMVDALDVPISAGEGETSAWRFRDMIELGNPDILQPDILNVGGLSELKRVFEMAEVLNKPVMPHCPVAGVNAVAGLHAYVTAPHAVQPFEFSEEFSGPVGPIAELFQEPILPEDGAIRLPDRPGFGLELNEDAVEAAIVE